jgi:hypothetical protein
MIDVNINTNFEGYSGDPISFSSKEKYDILTGRATPLNKVPEELRAIREKYMPSESLKSKEVEMKPAQKYSGAIVLGIVLVHFLSSRVLKDALYVPLSNRSKLYENISQSEGPIELDEAFMQFYFDDTYDRWERKGYNASALTKENLIEMIEGEIRHVWRNDFDRDWQPCMNYSIRDVGFLFDENKPGCQDLLSNRNAVVINGTDIPESEWKTEIDVISIDPITH